MWLTGSCNGLLERFKALELWLLFHLLVMHQTVGYPFKTVPILIYQGVHRYTKVCNLHVLQTIRVVIPPESSGWTVPDTSWNSYQVDQKQIHVLYNFLSEHIWCKATWFQEFWSITLGIDNLYCFSWCTITVFNIVIVYIRFSFYILWTDMSENKLFVIVFVTVIMYSHKTMKITCLVMLSGVFHLSSSSMIWHKTLCSILLLNGWKKKTICRYNGVTFWNFQSGSFHNWLLNCNSKDWWQLGVASQLNCSFLLHDIWVVEGSQECIRYIRDVGLQVLHLVLIGLNLLTNAACMHPHFTLFQGFVDWSTDACTWINTFANNKFTDCLWTYALHYSVVNSLHKQVNILVKPNKLSWLSQCILC